ncbi:hypothetical protein ACWGJP_02080 [Microbacterium sp. NPDC055903]
MSQPEAVAAEKPNTSLLIRGAIWIAIGALIAAALVCVVWVLIGDQDGLIARAFLTVLLLAGFAGIALLESSLARNRPDWLALASMITWIVALLVGAVKIWLPEDGAYFGVAERFFQLLLVVGILQLTLLHARLFLPAASRYVTVFTRVILYVTLIFLVALAAMLIFFLTFPHTIRYDELYWRVVVSLAILTAVGTTLIPLLNALFAPKKPQSAPAAVAQQWPTYADGVTPLPVLPDGSPDWNAYYTGYPTAVAPAPQQLAPGYAAALPPAAPVQADPVWPAPPASSPEAAWDASYADAAAAYPASAAEPAATETPQPQEQPQPPVPPQVQEQPPVPPAPPAPPAPPVPPAPAAP